MDDFKLPNINEKPEDGFSVFKKKEKPQSEDVQNIDTRHSFADFEKHQREQSKMREELMNYVKEVQEKISKDEVGRKVMKVVDQIEKVEINNIFDNNKEDNLDLSVDESTDFDNPSTFLTGVDLVEKKEEKINDLPFEVLQIISKNQQLQKDVIEQYLSAYKADIDPFEEINEENFKKDGILKLRKLDILLQEKENELKKVKNKKIKKPKKKKILREINIISKTKIEKKEKQKRPLSSDSRIKKGENIKRLSYDERHKSSRSFFGSPNPKIPEMKFSSSTYLPKEDEEKLRQIDEELKKHFPNLDSETLEENENILNEQDVRKKLKDIDEELKRIRNMNMEEKVDEKTIDDLVEKIKSDQVKSNIQLAKKEEIENLIRELKNKKK